MLKGGGIPIGEGQLPMCVVILVRGLKALNCSICLEWLAHSHVENIVEVAFVCVVEPLEHEAIVVVPSSFSLSWYGKEITNEQHM